MMVGEVRYSACRDAGGEWVVVEMGRSDQTLVRCPDASGAQLIAGLMNGDMDVLANASPETLARCRRTIGEVLRFLRPLGRPSVGAAAFPQV